MRGSVLGIMLALAAGALAQTTPLFSRDFEKSTDADSWKKLVDSDTLEIASKSDSARDVHSGSGALRYTFTPTKDKFPAIFCVLEDAAKARTVDVWLKSDMATAVLLVLAEKDEEGQSGERYNTLAYLPAGEWTHVTAPIEDFKLDENGPKHNGTLDAGKISAFGLLDALAVFATSSEQAAGFLGDHSGKQRLCIDDFMLLATATPSRIVPGIPIDAFDRNYLSWIPFKTVQISREGGGMKVSYERAAGRLNAVLHPIAPGTLTDAKSIDFTISSASGVMLAVGVEETDGGKWVKILSIPAGATASKQTVSLDEMTQQDDSKDPDNKLSPEKIKLLTFADVNFDAGKAWFKVSDIVGRK